MTARRLEAPGGRVDVIDVDEWRDMDQDQQLTYLYATLGLAHTSRHTGKRLKTA